MNTKQTVRVVAKHARRAFKKQPVPSKFMHRGVPYFSQWESPELVEKILTGQLSSIDDPNWKRSGARTKDEYAAWSASGCGMACTKMLVSHWLGREVPLVELGKKCAEYGGYTLPVEDSIGLVYGPYETFAEEELGLNAQAVVPLLIREIIEDVAAGRFVIASVSPRIRHVADRPKKKGGHLVLILGYDLNKGLLYFHNPSGFVKETQQYASISLRDFKKFFGARGIVVGR